MATAKSKAKSLSLQAWATRWERQAGKRYQYLVYTRYYHEHTKTEKDTVKILVNFSIVRRIFQLKYEHNLLPANKSRFDPTHRKHKLC